MTETEKILCYWDSGNIGISFKVYPLNKTGQLFVLNKEKGIKAPIMKEMSFDDLKKMDILDVIFKSLENKYNIEIPAPKKEILEKKYRTLVSDLHNETEKSLALKRLENADLFLTQ